MFWLRISRNLLPCLKENKIINYLGNNTWEIMMHHLFVFFIINLFLSIVSPIIGLDGFSDDFRKNIYYSYIPGNDRFKIFYTLSGIFIPLVIKYFICHNNKSN